MSKTIQIGEGSNRVNWCASSNLKRDGPSKPLFGILNPICRETGVRRKKQMAVQKDGGQVDTIHDKMRSYDFDFRAPKGRKTWERNS
jgi:hypothetical protein